MKRVAFTAFAVCVMAALAAGSARAGEAPSAPAPFDRLEGIEGHAAEVRIERIRDGQVFLAGREHPVPMADLRRIERSAVKPPPTAPASVAHLSDRARVKCTQVAVSAGLCTLEWACGEPLRLPLETVKGMLFVPHEPSEATLFEQALARPSDGTDHLLIRADGRVIEVPGALQEVRAGEVVFVWKEEARTVPRPRIVGIVLAQTPAPSDRAGWSLVGTSDGSRLWLRDVALDAGRLRGATDAGATVEVSWADVVGVSVRSDRVVFLSDLAPVAVEERPLVTYPWSYQRDRNVMGHPLTLQGEVFEKGLGVHALSRLTYELHGAFERFAATVGLDAAARGRGDCVFVVEADGREIVRRRMRGNDAPAEITADVRGVRRLTLVVEPGEDLDLADHADWADARLIRPRAEGR